MVERVNVQAFVFTRNPDLRFLILKRVRQKSGYWQPVCGGVEINEEPLQAVVREVFEETGITKITKIIDIGYSFTYRETKDSKLMTMQDICFGVEVEGVLGVKLSLEHECFKWCSKEDARKYLQWEHNLTALDRLVGML